MAAKAFALLQVEFTIMREILAWLLYPAHTSEKSQKQDGQVCKAGNWIHFLLTCVANRSSEIPRSLLSKYARVTIAVSNGR